MGPGVGIIGGYDYAALHVDSENSNSAPAVYLAAGFDVRSASDMYTLTSPHDVRRRFGVGAGRHS